MTAGLSIGFEKNQFQLLRKGSRFPLEAELPFNFVSMAIVNDLLINLTQVFSMTKKERFEKKT